MPLLEFHEATSPVLPTDLNTLFPDDRAQWIYIAFETKSGLDPNYSGSTTTPYITL
jgi:hypothetical protein